MFFPAKSSAKKTMLTSNLKLAYCHQILLVSLTFKILIQVSAAVDITTAPREYELARRQAHRAIFERWRDLKSKVVKQYFGIMSHYATLYYSTLFVS